MKNQTKMTVEENAALDFMLTNDPTNTPTNHNSDHDNYFRDSWAFDCDEKIPYWVWVKNKYVENN